MSSDPQRIEPTVLLLFVGLVFFTFILIGVEYFFPTDAQVFQVVAGVLTGFAGAFFARMKPGAEEKPAPPGTTIASATVTETRTPPQSA